MKRKGGPRRGKDARRVSPDRAVPRLSPDAPARSSLEFVEFWEELWDSDLADGLDEADIPAVRRLTETKEELARLRRRLRRTSTAKGRYGQDVLHPLWGELKRLEADIRRAEDKFAARRRALDATAEVAWSLDDLADEADGKPLPDEARAALDAARAGVPDYQNDEVFTRADGLRADDPRVPPHQRTGVWFEANGQDDEDPRNADLPEGAPKPKIGDWERWQGVAPPITREEWEALPEA